MTIVPESKLRNYLGTLIPMPGKFARERAVMESGMDPVKVRQVAHVQKLSELTPQTARVVTPAQLRDNVLLQRDCEAGVRLWVIDKADGKKLDETFEKSYRDLGGGAIGIHPPNLLRAKLDATPDCAKDFQGMDTVRVPQPIVDRFDDLSVPTRRASWLSRLVKNPQTLVYIVVFIYSSLRALPVVFVKEFHGSVLVLWSIDVVTAIPYTWGVLAMVLASKRWVRFAGAVTTIVTFIAPYIYFWLHGKEYPPYVIVIVGFLIFTGAGLEIVKYVQEKTLEKKYAQESACPRAVRKNPTLRNQTPEIHHGT